MALFLGTFPPSVDRLISVEQLAEMWIMLRTGVRFLMCDRHKQNRGRLIKTGFSCYRISGKNSVEHLVKDLKKKKKNGNLSQILKSSYTTN